MSQDKPVVVQRKRRQKMEVWCQIGDKSEASSSHSPQPLTLDTYNVECEIQTMALRNKKISALIDNCRIRTCAGKAQKISNLSP